MDSGISGTYDMTLRGERWVESESSRLMTDTEIPDCVSSCVLPLPPSVSIVIAIISHVTSSDISQAGHRGPETNIIIINQRARACHRPSGPVIYGLGWTNTQFADILYTAYTHTTNNPFPATMICERTLVAVHRKLNKPAGISCNICQTSCHNFRGPPGPWPGHGQAAARVNCNKLISFYKSKTLLRM